MRKQIKIDKCISEKDLYVNEKGKTRYIMVKNVNKTQIYFNILLFLLLTYYSPKHNLKCIIFTLLTTVSFDDRALHSRQLTLADIL